MRFETTTQKQKPTSIHWKDGHCNTKNQKATAQKHKSKNKQPKYKKSIRRVNSKNNQPKKA